MKTLRDRRLLRPTPITERNADNVFVMPFDPKRKPYDMRKKVLEWIENSTEGDFYIGAQLLYFVEDIDAMSFILFDMQKRIDNNEL